MKTQEILQLIKSRRSVYPPQFQSKALSNQVLRELLEVANWAPTHKLTEPWRFKVIQGGGLKRFGIFMAEKYRAVTPQPEFSIAKYEKLKMNPQLSGAVLAICMQRDAKSRIPEWEELASVAMAVQNIWLACGSFGLGGYWSTPELISHFDEFEPLRPGEKCIGLFYLGYCQPVTAVPPRKPIEEKVVWIDK